MIGHERRTRSDIPPGCELASEILQCSAEEFDLVAYLIACHHGKVRASLHAAPKDQDYVDVDGRGMPIRGTREGDRLPSIFLGSGGWMPEVVLTLDPAAMGLSWRTGASWKERVAGLLKRFGPAGLAYLEAVIRAADVRASTLPTNDPILTEAGL